MILLIDLLNHVKGGAIAVYSIMYVCVGVLLLKGVWYTHCHLLCVHVCASHVSYWRDD